MTQPDRRDERLADERLREILAELCGDERNGGLIRDMAFTVWSNCHHPTHEDGNSDWGNDNLPLVNVANERVREVIAALASELLRRREADEWQPIETLPEDDKQVRMFWLDWAKDCAPLNDPLPLDASFRRFVGQRKSWASVYTATHWRPLQPPPALKDPANDHH